MNRSTTLSRCKRSGHALLLAAGLCYTAGASAELTLAEAVAIAQRTRAPGGKPLPR